MVKWLLVALAVTLAFILCLAGGAEAKVIKGTDRADRLTGTSKQDRIVARKGNDVIFARDKKRDVLYCGPGRDIAVVDLIDWKSGCEIKKPPPAPHLIVKAPEAPKRTKPGKPGTVTTPIPWTPEPPSMAVSGEEMPNSNLTGWRLVFNDDFNTDVASWGTCTSFAAGATCPSLPAAYVDNWWAYPTSYQDTQEKVYGTGGFYTPANMSMSNSVLNIKLRRQSGTTQSNAPIPKKVLAKTYGRYSIRWKCDTSNRNYKIAWLLWRTEGSWAEIDFPEGNLDGGVSAFHHNPDGGQNSYVVGGQTLADSTWHTSTIEWSPGLVKFFMDGNLIGTKSGVEVPSIPMSWVIQSETKITSNPANLDATTTDGLVEVDWVAYWAYDPVVVTPTQETAQFGLVANADHQRALKVAKAAGATLLRMEFDINTPATQVLATVLQGQGLGIEVLPQAGFHGRIPTDAEALNMGEWARVLAGYVHYIEFGNETGYQHQGTSNQAEAYARAARIAKDATEQYLPRLLIQADDGNTGSGWVSRLLTAEPTLKNAAGWTVHPYGPGGPAKLGRVANELKAYGVVNPRLFVTEWGLATDNGATLNNNYGWSTTMTYAQAGDIVTQEVSKMVSSYPVDMVLYYSTYDLRATGTGERENYFGIVNSADTQKTGLIDDIQRMISRY